MEGDWEHLYGTEPVKESGRLITNPEIMSLNQLSGTKRKFVSPPFFQVVSFHKERSIKYPKTNKTF